MIVASPPLIAVTTLMAAAVIIEASLGFLGVGIAPPQATWGRMLLEAFPTMQIDADVSAGNCHLPLGGRHEYVWRYGQGSTRPEVAQFVMLSRPNNRDRVSAQLNMLEDDNSYPTS